MKKKKKKGDLLFVIGDMERGGAQRVVSILANYYAKTGYNVSIAVLLNNINGYDLQQDVKVFNLGVNSGTYIRKTPKLIFRLRKLIKTNKYDAIISFVGRVNLITILSNIFLNNYLVVCERNDPQYDNRNKFEKKLCKILYKYTDKIVFQTRYQQEWFGNKYKKNSIIIPNPVEIPQYFGNHLSNNIIAAGKFMKQKNYELLISSFSNICNKINQNLLIYGDGQEKDNIINLIKNKNIDNRVHIYNNIPNIHEVMQKNKFYIITSKYEGMSNSLLEALTNGMVCITTDWNGVREIIKDGYNGFIVENNNINQLAKKIEYVTSMDEKELKIISKNAVDTSKKYNIDNVIQKWNNFVICVGGENDK